MARLTIDEDLLTMALGDNDLRSSSYLDMETGDILPVLDGDLLADDEELQAAWEAEDAERFRRIDPVPSSTAFRVMEEFVEALPRGMARRTLEEALERRKPVRSFKDALYDFPDVRQAWFEYHEATYRQFALDWLRVESIDAELVRNKPISYDGPRGP